MALFWFATSSMGVNYSASAGHIGSVFGVAFDPRGEHLASAGEDNTVRIFTLNVHELVALARQRVSRHLTADECRKFLHRSSC